MPNVFMSLKSRKEYLTANYRRYSKATKAVKIKIIDEFCKTASYHRKSAIRLFNSPLYLTPKPRKFRAKTYGSNVLYYLKKIWKILDCPCGIRLEPALPEMVRVLEKFKELTIPEEVKVKLLTIKSATIDRNLQQEKRNAIRTIHSTTKPGSLLKKQIPIVLSRWDEVIPGYTEIDLVAHCGSGASGDFAFTLDITDLATGWSEQEAVLGKAQSRVQQGLVNIKERLPFKLLGIDPDNGSEFINWQLFNYCLENKIQFTRGRPGKKNDNSHIEEKNWTHVRKIVGYHRMETQEEIDILNRLYRGPLRLYMNFFQPAMKLQKKTRVEGRLKRKYDKAKTPYARVMTSPSKYISKEQKTKLKAQYELLNPAQLKRDVESLVEQLANIIRRRKLTKKPLTTK
jgi:hypothetical protein